MGATQRLQNKPSGLWVDRKGVDLEREPQSKNRPVGRQFCMQNLGVSPLQRLAPREGNLLDYAFNLRISSAMVQRARLIFRV